MIKVGFIGWRGVVGSVLVQRMKEEGDFGLNFEPVYFSTSQAGRPGPNQQPLRDAHDISVLKQMRIVVTCQGSNYTNEIYPRLRANGWDGYWLDAASALRMKNHAVIVLDPVNRAHIDQALAGGIKDYIGGNCTVSLMIMALAGLFQENLVEWVSSMTYQAASGAGAKNMIELVRQMDGLSKAATTLLTNPAASALELDQIITTTLRSGSLPTEQFGFPLAASLLPWIDQDLGNGQSREEWKGTAETNKILQPPIFIPIDGLCVRVGTMRCHSQALTIKLKRNVSLSEVIVILGSAHQWVTVIPNTKDDSLRQLTPAAVSGTLNIPVGRIRNMNLGPEYLTAFTVGDQLLWGAAEPIRRMLKITLEHLT